MPPAHTLTIASPSEPVFQIDLNECYQPSLPYILFSIVSGVNYFLLGI